MATCVHAHGLSDPLVDYTDTDVSDGRRLTVDSLFCDGELLAAQGRDTHFLALVKLSDPFRRMDGKRGRYCLVYRSLSQPCRDALDEAWCCVRSNENTYWQAKEIASVLTRLKAGLAVDLFAHFWIF